MRPISGTQRLALQAIRPTGGAVEQRCLVVVAHAGGDVLLHDVNEETGLVTVELIGACVSCPASTVTLKAGLERILIDRVPGVTEVIDAGAANHVIGETPVSL